LRPPKPVPVPRKIRKVGQNRPDRTRGRRHVPLHHDVTFLHDNHPNSYPQGEPRRPPSFRDARQVPSPGTDEIPLLVYEAVPGGSRSRTWSRRLRTRSMTSAGPRPSSVSATLRSSAGTFPSPAPLGVALRKVAYGPGLWLEGIHGAIMQRGRVGAGNHRSLTTSMP